MLNSSANKNSSRPTGTNQSIHYLISRPAVHARALTELDSTTLRKGSVFRQRITQIIAWVAIVTSFTYASLLWFFYDSLAGGLYDLFFGLVHFGAFYFIRRENYVASSYWTILWGGLQICGGIIFLVGPGAGFQLFFLVQSVVVFLLFTERSIQERVVLTMTGFVFLGISEFVSFDAYRVQLSPVVIKTIYANNLIVIFACIFAAIYFFTDETRKAYREQEKLVLKDKLTGLANRRFVEEYAGKLFAQCSRYGKPLSLIILGVDQVNQRRPEDEESNRAIKHVAKLIGIHLREADIPAHYGYGEFLVLLPETSIETASHIAERLRTDIENAPLPSESGHTLLTASIGISCCENNEMSAIEELIISADDALYEAKMRGQNQICRAFWPEGLRA